MNELLDQLEAKMIGLMDQCEALRRDNDMLRQEFDRTLTPLRQEVETLREELARERSVREATTQRIDALLLRVKERIPE